MTPFRRFLAVVLAVVAATTGLVASATGEDLYMGLSTGAVYRMDTAAMSAAPKLVKSTGLTMQYQGLAAGCGSLYVMTSTKIVRVNAATGAQSDVVTNMGSGSPYGLVVSADGTRAWWATDAGNIYTRLLSGSASTAPTAIVSNDQATLGSVPLLARVGDKLALRSTSGGGVLNAATSGTATITPVSINGGNQVFIGANETRAFYEGSSTGSGWTIGAINPFTATADTAFGTVPAVTAGLIAADASRVWVFEASGTSAYQLDIAAATPRTGYLVNGNLPGTAQGSAFETAALGCPQITSVSPAAGSPSGGTVITLTGHDLTGTTGVSVGNAQATNVTVVDDSTVQATTPAGTAGAKVAVGVTRSDGAADALADAFTYSPSIASISPASGPLAGGQTVTVTGTGLTGATALTIGGTAATSLTVVSDTQLTAVTPASGSGGAKNVVVTTPAGSHTATDAYAYVAGAPTISSISPTSGGEGGGTTITLTGTNLFGTTSVTVGGNACTNVSVLSGTKVTATVPPGAVGAAQAVAATNSAGTGTLPSAFTYTSGPTIGTVTPSSGPLAGGTTITITGTNLTGATSVQVDGADVTSFTVDSSTQITAQTPPGRAGAQAVAVTTSAGTVAKAGAFTYTSAVAPTITSLTPASGTTAGGTQVVITGTGFTGASAVIFGGTAAAGFTVDSATQITATTPAHSAGAADVVVTTAAGSATQAGGFTFTAPGPFPGPEPSPGPAGGTEAAGSSAPSGAGALVPTADIVTLRRAPVRTRAAGGRTRTTLSLRYLQGGRFSFYVETGMGVRVPVVRLSSVGTRVLSSTFWAPVVRDGKAGGRVSLSLVTTARPAAGTVLRVVLRRPDGVLVGQAIPLAG